MRAFFEERRQERNIAADGMALIVRHVGQYSPPDVAKRAGFLNDDVLVAFDGQTDLERETDVLTHVLRHRQPGDVIDVAIVRDGKKLTLKLPLP